jgi:hypothetical protein
MSTLEQRVDQAAEVATDEKWEAEHGGEGVEDNTQQIIGVMEAGNYLKAVSELKINGFIQATVTPRGAEVLVSSTAFDALFYGRDDIVVQDCEYISSIKKSCTIGDTTVVALEDAKYERVRVSP